MGTSADFAVRHKGQTYYQHTSYDGHTPNVVAQLAGTIAAMGVDVLRERMDLEGPPMATDKENNGIRLDRKSMGNAYLSACEARNQPAFNLEYTMRYEYGNPDFAHGGAIPLLAPTIEWRTEFTHRIEDASVILDLDRGALVVPKWSESVKDGSYDKGSMGISWSIDLTAIDGLNPGMLSEALAQADFDEEQPLEKRQTMIREILEKVQRGDVSIPGPSSDAGAVWRTNPKEPFEPRVYFLASSDGRGNHLLQGAIDVLRAAAPDYPLLGKPDTLLGGNLPNHGKLLIVDLRAGEPHTQAFVNTLFEALARQEGLTYEMAGQHSSVLISREGSMVSSSGDDGPEETPWDDGLIPLLAQPVQASREMAGQIKDAAQRKAYQRSLAVVSFDSASWSKAEVDGRTAPLDGPPMAALCELAVALSSCLEHAVPGSTRKRFEQLTEGQRSAVLENLSPVDRHLFTEVLQRTQRTPRKPSF